MAWRLIRSFGGAGEFDGAVAGLVEDGSGRLLAAAGRGIHVFDREGKALARWRLEAEALAVAAGPKGLVMVGHEGAVSLLDGQGRRVGSWRAPGKMERITSIAFAGGAVYLGDAGARLVRRFTAAGEWLNDIGGNNPTKGFVIPNGVLSCAAAEGGLVQVANSGKHRIERYTPEGVLASRVGRFDPADPAGFTGCCNPCMIALDGAGRLLTTEKAPPRVKMLDAGGALAAVIDTQMLDPMARNAPIAAGAGGRVMVGDPVRRQIHVFEEAR